MISNIMPKTARGVEKKKVWNPAPANMSFTGFKSFHSAVRKKLRPKFKDAYATVIRSENGKRALVAMMDALRGTPRDENGIVQAIIDAGFHERYGGDYERNKSTGHKSKQHANAIDFRMGEQADGAANELRGCFRQKDDGKEKADPWTPPEDLKIDTSWPISDMRIFKLIDAASTNKGPLAESVDRRKDTKSTSHGRVATFIVDYLAAIVVAYDRQFPNGHSA